MRGNVTSTIKNSLKRETALFEKWKYVPMGTPVLMTKDDGTVVKTVTRSLAWMLGSDGNGVGGHTAVIMLSGVSGGYALSRVVREEQ